MKEKKNTGIHAPGGEDERLGEQKSHEEEEPGRRLLKLTQKNLAGLRLEKIEPDATSNSSTSTEVPNDGLSGMYNMAPIIDTTILDRRKAAVQDLFNDDGSYKNKHLPLERMITGDVGGLTPLPEMEVSEAMEKFISLTPLDDGQKKALRELLGEGNYNTRLLWGGAGAGKTTTVCWGVIVQLLTNTVAPGTGGCPILLLGPDENPVEILTHTVTDILNSEEFKWIWNKIHQIAKSFGKDDLPESLSKTHPLNHFKIVKVADRSDNEFARSHMKPAKLPDFRKVDVAISTYSAVASPNFSSSFRPKTVWEDDNGRGVGPDSLIPIARYNNLEKLILIGDASQLSPYTHSASSQLSLSLFERLQHCDWPQSMLLFNHRMHPELSRIPQKLIYSEILLKNTAHVNNSDQQYRLLLQEVFGLEEPPLRSIWLDVTGDAVEERKNGFLYNEANALAVIKVLRLLFRARNLSSTTTVRVIAVYEGQVQKIKGLINADDSLRSHLKSRLFVDDIEGSQGHEADIVLFDLVRLNKEGNIGNAGDEKNLNVGFTRAKHARFIVGNKGFFTSIKGNSNGERFMEKMMKMDEWYTVEV